MMTLTLEIPLISLDKLPLGYKQKLEERIILQIYEDGYISKPELVQIGQKNFDKLFAQFVISANRKTVTTELYQKRQKYFSERGGTREWDEILQNVVSSRIDKEELPIWEST
jgi:hypothetical protein